MGSDPGGRAVSDVAGGLRARFLQDSLLAVVQEILTASGWHDPGRHHAPIVVIAEPVAWDQPVAVNTLAISATLRYGQYVEVGSNLTTDTIHMSIDFFAETDALGIHLTNDLRDGLRGRLAVGAVRGMFPIYDYRLATPALVGTAAVARVEIARQLAPATEAWTAQVHSLACNIEDTYYGESPPTTAYPGPDLAPGPDLYPVGG